MIGNQGDLVIRYVITALDKGTRTVVSANQQVTRSVGEANAALKEQTSLQERVNTTANAAAQGERRLTAAEGAAAKATADAGRAAAVAARENEALSKSAVGAAAAARRSASANIAAGAGIARAGRGMSDAGHKLSALSLPILAVGAASGKAAMDFQKNMEMIHTQAGAPQKEVDRLNQSVLNLAKSSTAQGPNELAQGLFHLESVGLRGAKAMDALHAAADGAAVGGADLEETSTALGSAWLVNIKGAGNLHHVMGILNATVGAGNMRMGDLVHALGTGLLPASKEAGLGIKDAMGALAVFTDEGYQASSASAQMSTALHFLYNPTNKAGDALNQMGLHSAQLAADMHRPRGLLVALRDLKAHLDEAGASGAKFTKEKGPGGEIVLHAKNRAAIVEEQLLGRILPGGRGRIMLTLLNQLDRYQMKLNQIDKTSKGFGESVARTHETAAFKIHHAWAQVQVAGVEIGSHVLPVMVPVLTKVAHAISSLADGFGKLSPHMKSVVVIGGLFVAALGPVLRIAGRLTQAVGFLVGTLGKAQKAIIGETAVVEANTVAEGENVAATEAASAAQATRGAAAAAGTEAQVAGTVAREAGTVEAGAAEGGGILAGLRGLAGRGAGVAGLRGVGARMLGRLPGAGMIGMGGMLATQFIPHTHVGNQLRGMANMGVAGASLGMMVGGPFGAAVGGVGGAAIGALMNKNIRDQMVKGLKDAGKWVADAFKPVGAAFATAFKAVARFVKPALKPIEAVIKVEVKIWTTIFKVEFAVWKTIITVTFRVISAVVKTAMRVIAAVFRVEVKIWTTIFKVEFAIWKTVFLVAFAVIYLVVRAAFVVLKAIFQAGMTVVTAVVKALMSVITAVWDAGFAVVKAVVKAAWTVIETYFKIEKAILTAVVRAIIAVVKAVWNTLKDVLGGPARAAWGVVKSVFNAGRSAVSAGIKAALSVVRAVWNGFKGAILNPVKDAFSSVVDTIGGWAGKAASAAGKVVDRIVSVIGTIVGKIGDIFSGAGRLIASIGRGIADWLNDHTPLGDKVNVGPVHFTMPKLAAGGRVPGARAAADNYPALLSPEEFVVTGGGERILESMTFPGVLDWLEGAQPAHFATGGRAGGKRNEDRRRRPMTIGQWYAEHDSPPPPWLHLVGVQKFPIQRAHPRHGHVHSHHQIPLEPYYGHEPQQERFGGRIQRFRYGGPAGDVPVPRHHRHHVHLGSLTHAPGLTRRPPAVPITNLPHLTRTPPHVTAHTHTSGGGGGGGGGASTKATGAHSSGGFLGTFDSTSYGPPWGGIQGRGVTATGINLQSSPARYLIAVDPKVIPLHTKVLADPNPFGNRNVVFRAEDTGGAIKGKHIDFYDWRGRSYQNRWGHHKTRLRDATAGGRTLSEKDTNIKEIALRALTAKQAKRQLPELMAPSVLDSFSQGVSLGQQGIGARLTDVGNQLLKDIITSSKVPYNTVKATVAGADGGSSSTGKLPSGVYTPNTDWNPNRKPIARWIGPYLTYGHSHGWSGIVTSGFRSRAEQQAIWNSGRRPAAKPGTSNHEGSSYPRGAVDVSNAAQLSSALQKKPGPHLLQWAGAKDPVHFSHPHGGSYRWGGRAIRPARFRTGGRMMVGGRGGAHHRRAEPGPPPTPVVHIPATSRGEVHVSRAINTAAALAPNQGTRFSQSLRDLAKELETSVATMIARYRRRIMDLRKGGETRHERVEVRGLQQSIRGLSDMPMHATAITSSALERIRRQIEGEIKKIATAKGGVSREGRVQILRLQSALSLVAAEAGRRVGEVINTVTETENALSRAQAHLQRQQRIRGLDTASDGAVKAQVKLLTSQEDVMRTDMKKLESARRQALRFGDKATAKAIKEQIDGIQDNLEETQAAVADANKQMLEASRQAVVDAATKAGQQAANAFQDAQTQFQQGQRVAGVNTAGSAAQKALADFLTAQDGVLNQQVAGLQQQLTQLQKMGGSEDQQQQIKDAIKSLNDTITENTVQAVEANRQAVLAGAQENVDVAQHGITMQDQGLQTLGLQQQISGTYDTDAAKKARADYINQNTIPAIQAQIAAYQTQAAAIQQQTPEDLTSLRQVQENIGTQQIALLQAQLDAQQQTADNTSQMLQEYQGSTVFEFGGQSFTDMLNIPVGS